METRHGVMKLGGLDIGTTIEAHPSAGKPARVRPAPAPAADTRMKVGAIFGYGAYPNPVLFAPSASVVVKAEERRVAPRLTLKVTPGYDIATDRQWHHNAFIKTQQEPPPPEYPKWIYAPTGGAIKVTSAEQRAQYPAWTETPRSEADTMDADRYIAARQKEMQAKNRG